MYEYDRIQNICQSTFRTLHILTLKTPVAKDIQSALVMAAGTKTMVGTTASGNDLRMCPQQAQAL